MSRLLGRNTCRANRLSDLGIRVKDEFLETRQRLPETNFLEPSTLGETSTPHLGQPIRPRMNCLARFIRCDSVASPPQRTTPSGVSCMWVRCGERVQS
jgi:hypothetical protein